MVGVGDRLELWDRAGWNQHRPRCSAASRRSRRVSTMPLDMRPVHVPALAGELIELLDPSPGQTAIDCTFGGGGHAQLIAERLAPRAP